MNTLFLKNEKDATTDVWITPKEILYPLGEFDLDPCASVKQPWPTANNSYTKVDNGLIQDWYGRVFMNPPYSNISPFMEKMAEHDNGIALTFARTDTQYFHKYVFPKASGILFIEGRLKFCKSSGQKAKSNGGAPSVLISYGNNADILENSTLKGKFVPL